MKIIYYILLTIICFSFNSCFIEKDDETGSATEIITNGKWYLESINLTSRISSVSVSVTEVRSCESDDYKEFYTDGRLRLSVGLVKCTEEDENSYSVWKLSNNDRVLSIPYNNEMEDFTITGLSERRLNLYIDKSETSGTRTFSIKGSMTLVKK